MSEALDAHLDLVASRDAPRALARLRALTAASPNEPLGWLFLSGALAAEGQGAEAVAASAGALSLSPADPMRYFFDLFVANACAVAGEHEQALRHARRSVGLNGQHLPSLVQMMLACVHCGRMDEARELAARYLVLKPTASVDRFVESHVCSDRALVRRDADILLALGLPP